jgi:hypothetical protein
MCSSGLFRSAVSGQPIGTIFKDLPLDDETDGLSRNISKELPLLVA